MNHVVSQHNRTNVYHKEGNKNPNYYELHIGENIKILTMRKAK